MAKASTETAEAKGDGHRRSSAKSAASQPQPVEHGIEPVFDGQSEVLVLGTMPSPKSREAGFFYGHPQNRFWRVLAALFDEPVPEDNAERADLLLRHHVALWDVLASCDIVGASDASIANGRPNDLSRILNGAPVRSVFCTGATATRLYGKLCEAACGLPAVPLPSPSPANASWSLPRLVEAYRPLAAAVTPFDPPVLDVAAVVALERAIATVGTPLDALMRRAGRFLAFEVRKLLEEPGRGAVAGMVPCDGGTMAPCQSGAVAVPGSGETDPRPVVILCGNGNNGGDGWVAGEYLERWGIPVRLVTAVPPEALTAEPARTAAVRAAAALGPASQVIVAPTDEEVARRLAGASVAIDALLGTGFSHERVRPPFDGWIRALNEAHTRGTVVVAADVPSGLSAQTGATAVDTVVADLTVTMIVPKPGLYISRDRGTDGQGATEGEPSAAGTVEGGVAAAGAADATGAAVAAGTAGATGAPLVPASCCGRIRVAPLAYIEPLLDGPAD